MSHEPLTQCVPRELPVDRDLAPILQFRRSPPERELRATRGRKDLAAARLGLSRFQLYHRLKRYQIEPD